MTAPVILLLMLVAQGWQTVFPVPLSALSTEGESPYFVLKPGHETTLRSKDGKLIIRVLAETRAVGGVNTRVVEEREWHGDELIEVSRNYFAIDSVTGDVYYFGENVDTYKKGRIVSHAGSWQHGVNGASFGLMMPGKPAVGMKFYQEQAKGVALDRAEIVSVSETLTTAAGTFERCVKTRETTPLEKFAREYKLYAPGVGLIQDGDMQLISHGYVR